MSREEFAKIMTMLLAFFPNMKLNTDNQVQMDLWYGMVKDLNFDIVKLAITKMVTDEPYAPSNMVGAIRKYYAEISGSTPVADTDGYGIVQKAIRCYGYARPEEALASLPLNVREAVMACGGWMQLCLSEEPENMRAQFNKAMASVNVRNNAFNRLNGAVKKNIEQLQEHSNKASNLIECTQQSNLDIREREQSEENKEAMKNVKDIIEQLKKTGVVQGKNTYREMDKDNE